MSLGSRLVHACLFQVCWFACVVGASQGWPALGPLLVVVLLPLHLWWRGGFSREATYLATAALLGFGADSALVLAGVLRFPAHTSLGQPSPLWMVALWVAFAATLPVSMAWLGRRSAVAVAAGAIAGPLSYQAGVALGALEWGPHPAQGVMAVAAEWALSLPFLFWVSRVCHGRSVTHR